MDWCKYESRVAHSVGLRILTKNDEAALSLVLKMYPELDVDWKEKGDAFLSEWLERIVAVESIMYRRAGEKLQVPNWKEVCQLPRKEFARTVLTQSKGPVHVYFNEQMLREWAGWDKPRVKRDGNVISFLKENPLPDCLVDVMK